MFDLRAKIFLTALLIVSAALLARAFQVQVIDRNEWNTEADKAMTRPELLDTTRGRLLDRKGRVLAEDVPCIDACVDYPALLENLDDDWVKTTAQQRIAARGDSKGLSRAQRDELLAAEASAVRADAQLLWKILADAGHKTGDEVEEIRRGIVRKVEARQRYVWYYRFQAARKQQVARELTWYQKLIGESAEEKQEIDEFQVDVAEVHQAHPILRSIDDQTYNALGKLTGRFTWLKLQPSIERRYPYGDAAAQTIGSETLADADDIKSDPQKDDALRRYWPNDLVGSSGLEKLCEPLLRGSRGRVERVVSDQTRVVSQQDAVAGRDVQTTLDVELQRDLQKAFKHVELKAHDFTSGQDVYDDALDMPGAAVVVDVATGEVLALASVPSYDANRFDDDYAKLRDDVVNRPLMNRATQLAVEPGSTVKPMVGLGAIMDGVNTVDGTILCDGFLNIDGHDIKSGFRCWTMKMYSIGYHHVPSEDPHANGYLTFSDALERSCNVFFETTAYRLGMERLSFWLNRFGLGRPTGIGIAESSGRLPRLSDVPSSRVLDFTLRGGTGQGLVLATPLQIANEAATIARNGIWVRPHLVSLGTVPPSTRESGADQVDLNLNPIALREAQVGMKEVVNAPAGTGHLGSESLRAFVVAGKTGSAQAAFLTIPETAPPEPGEEEIVFAHRKMLRLLPGTHEHPNARAAWYRYTGAKQDERSHAWFMGFAPADHPKVAMAVLVEFGGGGGATAGQVFNRLLDALVKQGYLPGA